MTFGKIFIMVAIMSCWLVGYAYAKNDFDAWDSYQLERQTQLMEEQTYHQRQQDMNRQLYQDIDRQNQQLWDNINRQNERLQRGW